MMGERCEFRNPNCSGTMYSYIIHVCFFFPLLLLSRCTRSQSITMMAERCGRACVSRPAPKTCTRLQYKLSDNCRASKNTSMNSKHKCIPQRRRQQAAGQEAAKQHSASQQGQAAGTARAEEAGNRPAKARSLKPEARAASKERGNKQGEATAGNRPATPQGSETGPQSRSTAADRQHSETANRRPGISPHNHLDRLHHKITSAAMQGESSEEQSCKHAQQSEFRRGRAQGVCLNVHTHVQTYTHTHMRTHIHTYKYTCRHAHANAHTQTHAHMHTRTCTDAIIIQIHMRARPHKASCSSCRLSLACLRRSSLRGPSPGAPSP